jgi:hypothetical protein
MPELTEYKEYYYLCTLFEAKAEIENYLNKHNIHGLVQKWEQGELK